jgi:hypothetical protein
MLVHQSESKSSDDRVDFSSVGIDTAAPSVRTSAIAAWVGRFRRPAFILLLAITCNTLLAASLPTRSGRYGAELGAMAASIAEGKGFSFPFRGYSTGPSAWMPPVFPYLLGGIFRVFGVFTVASFRAVTAFNIIVNAITCLLLYKCAGQVFGHRVGSYSACALASFPLVFYPLVWMHLLPGNAVGGSRSLFILPTHVWYSSLSALAILLLILHTLDPPHWSVYGVTWGVSSLINPTLLVLAPALVVYLLRQRQTWRYVLLVAGVAILCISPWLTRNYLLFHRLIPIRDNFGVQLKLGNLPGEKGLFQGDAYPGANPYELKRLAEMGEAEYNAAATQEALHIIRAHPAEFVVNTFRRIGYWWVGIPVESQTLGSLSFLKNSPLAVFSVVAFCGVIRAVRVKNQGAWLFTAVLLLYPAVYYVTQTFSLGYMYPIHPEMLALATSVVFRGEEVGVAQAKP